MAKRPRLNIISINNESTRQEQYNGNEELQSTGQQGHRQSVSENNGPNVENASEGYQSAHTNTLETSEPITNETEASRPSDSTNETTSQSSGAVKKTRGPTQMIDVWSLKSGERIVVTFNGMVQPIGAEGRVLTRFLGTLVKMHNHVGINFKDWRKVSDTTKETLWSIVKEKFHFHPAETEEVKKWVIANMGSKWKSWKNSLKSKNFDPTLSIDEMVANETDERVDKDQFKELVTIWVEPEFQEISEANKKRRLNNKEPHVTGSKSFARLAEELAIKNNGVRLTRGQLFIKTRTRKDGTIVNAQAASVVDSLHTVMNEVEGAQGSENNVDWRNDDLAKVKGPEKRGRVRCIGNIPVVKDKGASSYKHQQLATQDPEVPALRAQLSRLSRTVDLLVGAFKQNMTPDQLNVILHGLSNEVNDQLSPTILRSSSGSHQPDGAT